MRANEFVDRLHRERASAIIRTDSQERASAAMQAAIAGGFKIVEFTLTIPGVFELIRDFSRRSDLTVGAGTVLTTSDVKRSVEAGACFIVSPVTDEVVIRAAGEHGVAAMPGTHTPTEMYRAHTAGAPLCKLFPAPAGGPTYVRSVLNPMPFLRIVPTNGVDESNAAEYLAAGAHAVGFVAALFPADAIARGDWQGIKQRARALLAACRRGPG
jgi:Entner-Doudoroff aldolase